MANNQPNAKQHPDAELFIFENYLLFSYTSLSKNKETYSKRWAKEQACFYSEDYTINHNENEDENEKSSRRYDSIKQT